MDITAEMGLHQRVGIVKKAELSHFSMATGVAPANSYRVLLDPNGEIAWETVKDGKSVRYRDEPDTGFRRRFVANLWKLLPIDSQL